MTLDQYQERAMRHGEPTMELKFVDGILEQLYHLKDGPSTIRVWCPVRSEKTK